VHGSFPQITFLKANSTGVRDFSRATERKDRGMSGRTAIMAGNWKMHKTASEARELIQDLAFGLERQRPACEVVVAPPFTSISAAVQQARGSVIQVAAQDLHWEDKGAFTGEISGPMLREAGCSFAIIGHSERRQFFGETDETVNLKIAAAIRHGLTPIFCLGETIEERQAGVTFEVMRRQLRRGLGDITPLDAERFVMAYEPVWAIGTGHTATPKQAQEVHSFLRNELTALLGQDFSARVRVLYGGSVKPDNARSLMSCEDIDGGLIGGASLNSADFLAIIGEGI
jgi:triosephosphate isomerase (TIM)